MDRWKKILKQIKALGYKGGDDDIAAIVKFLAGENEASEAYTLTDSVGDINSDTVEAVYKAAKKPKAKAVAIPSDEDEGETDQPGIDWKARAKQAEARAKGHGEWAGAEGERQAERETKAMTNWAWTPKGVQEARIAKAYNRRVSDHDPKAHFGDADEAAAFGAFVRLSAWGNRDYPQKVRDKEICHKLQSTYDDASGGITVPDDFDPSLFRLREKVGGGHMLAEQVSMARDKVTRPRRTAGLSVMTPGEGGTITGSSMAFDSYELVATKRAGYAEFTSEMFNDSAINIADVLGEEGLYALEADLENAYINGDGTSTYWGVVGLGQRFQNVLTAGGGTWATDAGNLASVTVGSGNLWSELVQADFDDVIGRQNDYDIPYTQTWLCGKRFKDTVINPKIRAAGGAVYEVFQGVPGPTYNGGNIVTSTKMPRFQANSQFCAFYGDFRLASAVGRVRGSLSVATSDQVGFLKDTTYIRFMHRAAICVHDVGNYSGTAASRVFGPIVGLLTAAS